MHPFRNLPAVPRSRSLWLAATAVSACTLVIASLAHGWIAGDSEKLDRGTSSQKNKTVIARLADTPAMTAIDAVPALVPAIPDAPEDIAQVGHVEISKGLDRELAEQARARVLELPFTLQSHRSVELTCPASGTITGVHVELGDAVEPGQLLAVLDAPHIADAVKRHEMLVARAATATALAQSYVRATETKRQQTESLLEEQEALLRLREAELKRTRLLFEAGTLQQQRLDESIFAVETAKAGIGRIKTDLAVADAEIATAKSKLSLARCDEQLAKSQLQQAVNRLEECKVTSPFAGIITCCHVQAGQYLADTVPKQPLFTLEAIDMLRGTIHVPPKQIDGIGVGTPITLCEIEGSGDSPSNDELETVIQRMSGVIHPTTQMMRVEFDLPNPVDLETGRRRWRSGVAGVARLIPVERPERAKAMQHAAGNVKQKEDSQTEQHAGPAAAPPKVAAHPSEKMPAVNNKVRRRVPSTAVGRDALGRTFITAVTANETYRRHPVRVLEENDAKVTIELTGLDATHPLRVVARDPGRFRSGQKVQPAPASSPERP